MNFREQLLKPPEKEFPMNGSWVPVTPEKPTLITPQPMLPDWQGKQIGRMNLQEIDVPGSGYLNEMLHYKGQNQNLHMLGLLGQTGGYGNFDGASAERKRIINHIAGSCTLPVQYGSQALNSNPLEVLLMKNATNIASVNRNLDANISTAAARSLLPKDNQEGCGERDICASGFMLNQSNYYSGSNTGYNDLNRLNIHSMNLEFDSGSSDSLLNNDFNCSVSNPLTRSFCDLLNDGKDIPPISEYDLNFAPVAETDVGLSFTNFLQSMPVTLDQPVAESSSLEKDKHEILATSTENESHNYCNGLLQHIVDSSPAVISISEGENKGTESDNSGRGTGLGIDLNKTPEQKAPKRRKHRPKVITEGKPKRNPKPATQKKAESKENPPKKRKYVRKNVPKEAATPQADIMRENGSSNATTLKSCRRALNFDLERSRDQIQSKIVCQQEILHRDKAFDITSDYQAAQLHNGANTACGTNSVLLVSNQEALDVENQQYRNTEDITLLLNQKLTDTFMPEEITDVALPVTTEELQAVIDKDPDQVNVDLCQERANRCMQQYIHTKGIGNVHFLSETDFENFQMAKELMPLNSLRLVPNNLSSSTEGRGSKRKHSHGTENQHVSATTQLASSLLRQELFQVDESCNGTTLGSVFFKTQKRKEAKDRLPTKVYGRPNCPTTNNGSQDVKKKGKKEPQLQFNDETPNCRIERKRYDQKQKTGIRKHTGVPNQVYPALIDDIIGQLEGLNLGESNIIEEGQNAIVPYKGNGSIVPFEEFDFAKKRKARPKVDLDPETERIWKLLMGKEGSLEDLEGTDKEKEKLWEEERKVFRGRVDSFIARMHLVQGDRRFSQWKGSVVDSVIGVFLTQNVSDHLSSSAFMSLAARFPLASTSNKRASDIVGTNGSFEEPEVCTVNTDDTIISYGRLLSQPACHHSFATPHVTRELWSEASGINISIMDPKNQIPEDEIISSQDSLDSSITQGTGGIRSSSGSNSEAEGPTIGCKQRIREYSMSEKPLQVEKTTMFQEFYNSVNGVSLFDERTKNGQAQLAEHAIQESRLGRNDSLNSHSAFSNPPKQALIVPSADYDLNDSEAQGHKTFQMNDPEPSWPGTASIFSQLEETNYRRFTISEVGRTVGKSTEQQHRSVGSPELPRMDLYGSFSKHLIDQQNFSQSISHACHQQSSNHNLVDNVCPEGTLFTDSESTSKKLDRGQDCRVQGSPNIPKHTRGFYAERIIPEANRQIYSDNSRLEPGSEEHVYSSGLKYKESKSNVSKAKKVKSESEKNNAVDWDNLRKQAQTNGRKKERNKDTMDSLDYEAVRCASVKQISEAIKERGMNNMLAERIKEFLNRLVRDHGSIDLEWLRDVPPDKAKDYLLSIRGLGLKSVECVRLLTLHHLAFPVDTNVGRIAVRLGWVPLQPLPESLQLHLLELYPMLESIQKYLWPRFCKLDQRILYELHYQMITFGKVFCTKSKPNCNACPMRAECRHFASAFASARLALPGPEEKGIVNIPVPFTEQRNPVVNMNPLPLPPPEYNILKEISSQIRNCEPIIEEPATPEPECIESLESDIEDSFYEDPDQIPTIKLNLETLSMNVRDCVQGNRELQECDMSKALVLLNQEAASIPAPKLKNVSRLRTEHQVYELPDSHPLLEKMDKREPDDPSPYLLAIWTPGETANSIEPPERRCTSQDPDHMCNDNTCFACNSIREANLQTVRGTILIPCRTAMRGSFPLNGTYFQVNEIMHPVLSPFMSQGDGYGICQEGPYTLEPPYQQYSKASQLKEFSFAFGEDLFVSGDLTNKHVPPALLKPDYTFQRAS